MSEIGLEIKNLNNIINRNFKNLSSVKLLDEITDSNGYILVFLAKHSAEVITQKSIEGILGITRSTASTILSRMEKKELIKREVLSTDTRMKRILITEKGKSLCLKIDEEATAFNQDILKGFKDCEIKQFLSYVERMKKNMEGER
ncbi:MAG: MarR family transcriptional regulator [Anaeroplasmataceae bacterium]|nr:MarR family transcriptional regulator [Anaeroplasmataceae bacterium]